MRKHISVFNVLLRTKLRGMMITVLGCFVAGVLGYYLFGLYTSPLSWTVWQEVLFEAWFIACFAGYACSCIQKHGKGKNEYLLKRLQISERMVFFWDGVCNFMMLLLLWAMEILTIAVDSRIFMAKSPYYFGTTSIAEIIYMKEISNHLIPLLHERMWIGTLGLTVLAAISITCYSVGICKHNIALRISAILFIMTYIMSIQLEFGEHLSIVMPALMTCGSAGMIMSIINITRKEKWEDKNEKE